MKNDCFLGQSFFISFSYEGRFGGSLLDHIAAHIWLEGSRDADAFWCLVVLQEGSYDTGQCQSRAVEGVCQSNFLILSTAITAVEAIGLVGIEVRGR